MSTVVSFFNFKNKFFSEIVKDTLSADHELNTVHTGNCSLSRFINPSYLWEKKSLNTIRTTTIRAGSPGDLIGKGTN